MQRLLVRCCCNPQKILGSLPYDGTGELRVPVLRSGSFSEIILRVQTMQTCVAATMHERLRSRSLGKLIESPVYREMAYKSDDIPIETLRRIPAFIEAPHDLNRFDYVCPYCFNDLRTCPCGEKKS